MGKTHAAAVEGEIHQVHDAEYNTNALAVSGGVSPDDIYKLTRITAEGGIEELLLNLDTAPSFKRFDLRERVSVSTTNDTETNLFSLATTTDYVYHVSVVVLGTVDTGGNAATYKREAGFKNDSGTLSIIGSTTADHTAENDANWDCQIEVSGTNIQVNVTGVAATNINWVGYVDVYAIPNS